MLKVAKWLERWDYKPGHTAMVTRTVYSETRVILEALVPDAYHPDRKVRRVSIHDFPDLILDNINEEEFEREMIFGIRRLVREFEEHEMDEFFTLDGKHLFDPHTREGRG